MPGNVPPTPTHVPRDGIATLMWAVSALRRGWRLIAVSMAACLTLAILYLAGAQRMYQATARLLVLQQGGRPLNMANADPSRLMEGAEDYIPTHSAILSSPMVVKRAIDTIGVDQLPTLRAASKAGSDPLTTAIGQVKVTRPDRQAKIVKIDYWAQSPEEAERMLRGIIDSYERFLEDTFQKKSNEVVGLIGHARDELSKELKKLEDAYVELRRKSNITLLDETGRSSTSRRIEQWERAVGGASIKAIELKAQLELGRTMAREGSELWAIAHALNQLGGDSASLNATLTTGGMLSGPSDYIRQLSQEQQQVAEKYGPDYAKVREIHEQITRAQERIRLARGRLQAAEVKELLGSLERGVVSAESLRDDLDRKLEREQERSRQDEIALLTESTLKGKLERQRTLFNTVVDQLKQAQFVSDFNSISAQAIEPAVALRKPVRPMVTITLAVALFCGAAAGAAAAIVVDRRDPLIRSVDEMRSLLGLAVVGQIPEDRRRREGTPVEFGRLCHDFPRSSHAESFRAVRTNLELLRRRHNFRVLLITSPHPGDGKSSVSSNIAISLAHAGRKVLLIDADLRKPRQHRIHSASGDVGLVDVLRGGMSLGASIQPSDVPFLHLVYAGPEIPNPAEMLASARLAEVLAEARESYDLVIIDSAPLLAVTDSAILGGVVDAVLLVARDGTVKHGQAVHIRETLGGLGTMLLGVIVNKVAFGSGGYGYGYGSGYGYGNGYGYGANRGRTGEADDPAMGVSERIEAVPVASGGPSPATNGTTH